MYVCIHASRDVRRLGRLQQQLVEVQRGGLQGVFGSFWPSFRRWWQRAQAVALGSIKSCRRQSSPTGGCECKEQLRGKQDGCRTPKRRGQKCGRSAPLAAPTAQKTASSDPIRRCGATAPDPDLHPRSHRHRRRSFHRRQHCRRNPSWRATTHRAPQPVRRRQERRATRAAEPDRARPSQTRPQRVNGP